MTTGYIEISGTGIEVTPAESNELLDLFNHKGWAVLQRIRGIEKDAAIMAGMSITSNDEQRAMNRAVFHKILADEQFPAAVAESVAAFVKDAK